MAASASTTLGVLILAVAAAGLWFYLGPGPAAPGGGSNTVILRQGARLPEIAASLERGHAVSSAAVFMAAAQLTGEARHLKAGEYAFPSRASMAQVIGLIRRGEVVRHMITIPEGLTSEQAVDILMNAEELTGAAPIPPEGSILPETYEVRRGEDRSAVLQRMMDARDELLRTLWAQRRDGLPLTSPEQAVILASIVEKETALASERPRVAAVFVNRLIKGVRLASDPTIVYGLTGGRAARPRHPPVGDRHADALQHLSDRRPAADADLQSGPRLAGRDARSAAHRRALFRRQRPGRAQFFLDLRAARKERRALAGDRTSARTRGRWLRWRFRA